LIQPAAYAGLVGNAFLSTATYGNFCTELDCVANRRAWCVPSRARRPWRPQS